MVRFSIVIFILLVWMSSVGQPVHAAKDPDGSCKQLFLQEKFIAAAQCFEKRIPKRLRALSAPARITVGRRLRNASTSYSTAAKHTNNRVKANYYRDLSMRLLKRYLQDKLYENPYRQSGAIVQIHRLRKQIGFATMTLITQIPQAQFTITGFQFRKQAQGPQWSQQVRPGAYLVTLIPPQGGARQVRKVTIKPKQSLALTFPALGPQRGTQGKPARGIAGSRVGSLPRGTPPSSAGHRIWGWGLLGFAGAMAIGSGILFGVGAATFERRARLHSEAPSPPQQSLTDELEGLGQHGERLQTTSAIFVAIAGTSLILGVVLLLTGRTKAKKEKTGRETSPKQGGPPQISVVRGSFLLESAH